MKTTCTLFIALVLFVGVSTTFAQGIYMELIPASGGVTLPAAPGEYKLTSFQGSIQNAITIGSASGGAGAGKAQFDAVEITKQIDKSSSQFQFALTRGAHYDAIRFNFRNASGQLIYRIAIGTAFVTKYSTSAAEVCPSGCVGINETITIAYGEVAYIDYTQTPAKTVVWSQIQNKGTVDPSLTDN